MGGFVNIFRGWQGQEGVLEFRFAESQLSVTGSGVTYEFIVARRNVVNNLLHLRIFR